MLKRMKKILFLHVQPQLEHLIKQKPQFDTLIELQGCPSWARILSQPSYLVIVKADSLSELTWIGCEYLQLDVYAYVYEMASRRVQTPGHSMMNPLDSMCGAYEPSLPRRKVRQRPTEFPNLTITNWRLLLKTHTQIQGGQSKKLKKSQKFSQKSETSRHQFDNSNHNSRWICYLF